MCNVNARPQTIEIFVLIVLSAALNIDPVQAIVILNIMVVRQFVSKPLRIWDNF